MGQGLYRIVGFGVVNAPHVNWDENIDIYGLVHTSYECAQNYVMIPFGIDDSRLRESWTLGELPKGLPHVDPRTAIAVKRCKWWPDVGNDGIWVCNRIEKMWEFVRKLAKEKGIELPGGEPVFACDWD